MTNSQYKLKKVNEEFETSEKAFMAVFQNFERKKQRWLTADIRFLDTKNFMSPIQFELREDGEKNRKIFAKFSAFQKTEFQEKEFWLKVKVKRHGVIESYSVDLDNIGNVPRESEEDIIFRFQNHVIRLYLYIFGLIKKIAGK